MWALLLMGAVAGAAAQASAHPLDVVRRRMQMQGLAASIAERKANEAKTEGGDGKGVSKARGKKAYSNMFAGLCAPSRARTRV